MRAVVQRVSSASVTVGDRTVGRIAHGLLVLVGVENGDGPADVEYIAGKIRDLRVFEEPADATKRLNRSVQEVGGAVLLVSQFTLIADCREPSDSVSQRESIMLPLFPGMTEGDVERVARALAAAL